MFFFTGCLNFLKLCKIKYYNYCLVHHVQVNMQQSCGFCHVLVLCAHIFIVLYCPSPERFHCADGRSKRDGARWRVHLQVSARLPGSSVHVTGDQASVVSPFLVSCTGTRPASLTRKKCPASNTGRRAQCPW